MGSAVQGRREGKAFPFLKARIRFQSLILPVPFFRGWRLAGLAPLLREGKLASVLAVEARYYGLSSSGPFVSDIRVKVAQKD